MGCDANIQPHSSESRDEPLTFFDNFEMVLNKSSCVCIRFRTNDQYNNPPSFKAESPYVSCSHSCPPSLSQLSRAKGLDKRSPSERG